MIDKDILEGLAELNETDLKRIKLLVDNKLSPYWYAEWTENGKRRTKYLGKTLSEV